MKRKEKALEKTDIITNIDQTTPDPHYTTTIKVFPFFCVAFKSGKSRTGIKTKGQGGRHTN
jgi:hypothetical protein